jgi:hypothetical protein
MHIAAGPAVLTCEQGARRAARAVNRARVANSARRTAPRGPAGSATPQQVSLVTVASYWGFGVQKNDNMLSDIALHAKYVVTIFDGVRFRELVRKNS